MSRNNTQGLHTILFDSRMVESPTLGLGLGLDLGMYWFTLARRHDGQRILSKEKALIRRSLLMRVLLVKIYSRIPDQ